MQTVDLRCPRFSWALLARLTYEQARDRSVDGEYIEFACGACKQQLRKRGLIVGLVLHHFSLTGEFIETLHQA